MDNDKVEEARATLLKLQAEKKVAAFSVKGKLEVDRPEIWLSWVGKEHPDVRKFIEEHQIAPEDIDPINQDYYFLSSDLRPGSGLIRVFGGRPEGPGGTLTCLLASRDGQDIYFAAAGHVLTNFWRCKSPDSLGSIYRYRKGFPATNSTRFLGKRLYLPDKRDLPKPLERRPMGRGAEMDIGIVKLEGEAELKQRTTCYGSFGEWPELDKDRTGRYKIVMKCGSQETHWTKARIKRRNANVSIYGPDGVLYRFRKQIILEDIPEELPGEQDQCKEPLSDDYPKNPPGTPFAVPGDSGTMVVDKATKMPIGMLIAGSILNGRYVMTPFETIRNFWEKRKLVMLRA